MNLVMQSFSRPRRGPVVYTSLDPADDRPNSWTDASHDSSDGKTDHTEIPSVVDWIDFLAPRYGHIFFDFLRVHIGLRRGIVFSDEKWFTHFRCLDLSESIPSSLLVLLVARAEHG